MAVTSELIELGFDVREVCDAQRPPIVVASRPGQGATVGLAGHYDVEEAGDGWTRPSFCVTQSSNRIYGRGLADNLGPLWLRLTALRAHPGPLPPMLWVLQGEEEIGSEAAHRLYPKLALPSVTLWLEETGYFEADGTQRLLLRDIDADAAGLVDAAVRVACLDGRVVKRHARFLNKAFGQHRCPFLTHLVVGRPYMAIGPNDPASNIHGPNESLPLGVLAVSVEQFMAVLTAAAKL